jgi:hypothetical protein
MSTTTLQTLKDIPVVANLKSAHIATIAALQRSLTGGKLTADEKQAGLDLLAGLAESVAVDTHLAYRLEDGARAARMREFRDPTQLGAENAEVKPAATPATTNIGGVPPGLLMPGRGG